MPRQTTYDLEVIRQLNKESNAGLLFSYRALKHFEYNYDKALAYLKSDEFKNSIHKLDKVGDFFGDFLEIFSHKSIDKYHQNGYDVWVCRIVRYKYVRWTSPELASKMNFCSFE